MKRIYIFTLIIIAVLCLLLNSCDTKPNDSSESTNDIQTKNTAEGGEENASPETEKASVLEQDALCEERGVPGRSIRVNYRSVRQCESKANSLLFYIGGQGDVILLTYDDEKAFSGTIEDAFEILNDGRIFNDINNSRSNGDFRKSDKVYKIEVDSIVDSKFGELECKTITGTIKDNNETEWFVYGHCFILEKTPCFLSTVNTSINSDDDANRVLIEEIDAMMQTVRVSK